MEGRIALGEPGILHSESCWGTAAMVRKARSRLRWHQYSEMLEVDPKTGIEERGVWVGMAHCWPFRSSWLVPRISEVSEGDRRDRQTHR